MTVEVRVPMVTYLGNGSTTVFSAPWRFLAAADLKVSLIDANSVEFPQVLAADYTVSGGTTDSGGTVTMLDAPPSGSKLRIYRATPARQPTDYEAEDNFPAETHELGLDRVVMIVQEQDASIADLRGRSLRVPPGETVAQLPGKADLAGRLLGFDLDRNPIPYNIPGGDPDLRADLLQSSGSGLVGFIQSGAGAVARSAQAKMREAFSVTDFLLDSEGADISNALGRALAAAAGRPIFIPAGAWTLSDAFSVTAPIFGAGVLNTVITAAQADAGLKIRSSSEITDLRFSGGGIAPIGLVTEATNSAMVLRRVRLENFTEKGLSFQHGTNNCLFQELRIEFCPINYHLKNVLNCTFLNCLGNLADAVGADGRNIWAESGNRNTRFIGGIFERGNSDYQVASSGGVHFAHTEINSGSTKLAHVLLTASSIYLDHVMFTMNGTAPAIDVQAGAAYVNDPTFSGRGGRAYFTMFKGRVIYNGRGDIPHQRADWSLGDTGQNGSGLDGFGTTTGATAVYNATDKCLDVTVTSSGASGIQSGLNVGGTYRAGQVLKGQVVVTDFDTLTSYRISMRTNISPFRREIVVVDTPGLIEFSYVCQGDEAGDLHIGSSGTAGGFKARKLETWMAAA